MADLPIQLRGDLEGRYRIERELGRGGMATVYLARDLRHDRLVALKVIRSDLVTGAERFVREIRLTAGLQHPHILPLLDSGTVAAGPAGPRPWYVMPYVEGESLRCRLEREHQLPLEDALAVARDVAGALACAHAHGIVHRDIKPENILLSGGLAVVADFGLARAVFASDGERLTSTGLVLGTPAYMSPEQVAGDPDVRPAADIYALGAVVYEMLAGSPPFTGPSTAAMLARRLTGPPPGVRSVRPTVPAAVEQAITRALATDPADRFPTAEAFARALDESRTAAPTAALARLRRGHWVAVAAVLLVLAGYWFPRRLREPAIIPSASRLAVLPFEPSGPDTALGRLGRDLVFTLSAALDGLGGIQVVDAHSVLAAARAGGALRSVEEATALGRRFGAGGVVHGSLVRVGPAVRLDFVVLPSDAAEPVARGSATAPPDSVAALTDSATRALLRGVWARGSPPTPSLDGALKTRSVDALRAFLQGEGEIAGGKWDSAAASYERAMVADPTFRLAQARYLYARNWSLAEAPESLLAALSAHRAELPERERLTTSAIRHVVRNEFGPALERSREASERYPGSWFGWLLYGDELLHSGPLLGHSQNESRAALQRALDLNPGLLPAWEHLMLLAMIEQDTAASGAAIRALDSLDAWPGLSADGFGNRKVQFRYLDAIARGDSAMWDELRDSVALDTTPTAAVVGTFYDPLRYGFFEEQTRVSRMALRAPVPPAMKSLHQRLLIIATAARGAWDSALVAMDRLAAEDTLQRGRLGPYGMAVVAAWVGAVDAREAAARRGAAAAAAGDDSLRLGELAWLDGIAAATARDRKALGLAREALRLSGDPGADALDRALGAFEAELRGATREAGSALAGLEWEEAARGAPDLAAHPWAIAVHRLAAARWLASTGDVDQAARLLRWVDGPHLLLRGTVYGVMLSGPTFLERGRIERRKGRATQAAEYYREFLRRVDRPTPRYRPQVEEIRAILP